ncbi:MAG: hypothetical protein H8E13_14175, partial [Actinobacteria bacterium]|nr:hypothetical protein [Actinomycetota bacterium]
KTSEAGDNLAPFETEKIEEKTSEAGDNLAPFETEKLEEKTSELSQTKTQNVFLDTNATGFTENITPGISKTEYKPNSSLFSEIKEIKLHNLKDSNINKQYKFMSASDIRNSDGNMGFPTLFGQPLLVIKPDDSKIIKKIKGIDSRSLPIGSTIQDLYRIGKFTLSTRGLMFNIKQILLQGFNTREDSRIFNPLGPIGSAVPFLHVSRVFGGGGGSYGDVIADPHIGGLYKT